jgi:hypothetical protein
MNVEGSGKDMTGGPIEEGSQFVASYRRKVLNLMGFGGDRGMYQLDMDGK